MSTKLSENLCNVGTYSSLVCFCIHVVLYYGCTCAICGLTHLLSSYFRHGHFVASWLSQQLPTSLPRSLSPRPPERGTLWGTGRERPWERGWTTTSLRSKRFCIGFPPVRGKNIGASATCTDGRSGEERGGEEEEEAFPFLPSPPPSRTFLRSLQFSRVPKSKKCFKPADSPTETLSTQAKQLQKVCSFALIYYYTEGREEYERTGDQKSPKIQLTPDYSNLQGKYIWFQLSGDRIPANTNYHMYSYRKNWAILVEEIHTKDNQTIKKYTLLMSFGNLIQTKSILWSVFCLSVRFELSRVKL